MIKKKEEEIGPSIRLGEETSPQIASSEARGSEDNIGQSLASSEAISLGEETGPQIGPVNKKSGFWGHLRSFEFNSHLISLSLRSRELMDRSVLLRLSLRSRLFLNGLFFLASRFARGNWLNGLFFLAPASLE